MSGTPMRGMLRWVKWLWWPLLVLSEIVLVRAHLLSTTTALALVGVIEGTLIITGLVQIARTAWRTRLALQRGDDFWLALEAGLTVLFPQPIARLLALEPRFWYCLVRWLFWRPRPAPDRFTYHRASVLGIFLIAVAFSAPVEMLLSGYLIPWPWLKVTFLVVEIYTALWVVALNASLSILPYHLTETGLWLRYGLIAEVFVPYDNIVSVRAECQSAASQREGMSYDQPHHLVAFAIGGATQLTLTLGAPLAVRGLLRATPPATTITLAADKPQELAAALAARIGELCCSDAPLTQPPGGQ